MVLLLLVRCLRQERNNSILKDEGRLDKVYLKKLIIIVTMNECILI